MSATLASIDSRWSRWRSNWSAWLTRRLSWEASVLFTENCDKVEHCIWRSLYLFVLTFFTLQLCFFLFFRSVLKQVLFRIMYYRYLGHKHTVLLYDHTKLSVWACRSSPCIFSAPACEANDPACESSVSECSFNRLSSPLDNADT